MVIVNTTNEENMKRIGVGLTLTALMFGGLGLTGLGAGAAGADPVGPYQWCPGQRPIQVDWDQTSATRGGRSDTARAISREPSSLPTAHHWTTCGRAQIHQHLSHRRIFRRSCAAVSSAQQCDASGVNLRCVIPADAHEAWS